MIRLLNKAFLLGLGFWTFLLGKHCSLGFPKGLVMRMQIALKCGCEAIDCQEWSIVEVQGSLEIQNQAEEVGNLTIGQLCRGGGQDKFVFTVGYHELEGTRIALRKPLLVIRKSADSMDGAAAGQSQVDIVGIIRHKLLFKNRPKALISKPEVKVKKARLQTTPLADHDMKKPIGKENNEGV